MLSIKKMIQYALKEDIKTGDITTQAIIPKNKFSEAVLLSKQKGVLAGQEYFEKTFFYFDKKVKIKWLKKDGDSIEKNENIAFLSGKTRSLLTAERTALNFIQHLSGIATYTRECVSLLKDTPIQLLDTRKTTPLYRAMEKQAVVLGGGKNHRFGLYDMFLIKDNHIAACGSIQKAVMLCKKKDKTKKIEVEVSNQKQVLEALETPADILLFDNMKEEEIAVCASIVKKQSDKKIEVSGNMTKEKLEILKKYPIDFISMGALTHSAPAFDFSLLIRI